MFSNVSLCDDTIRTTRCLVHAYIDRTIDFGTPRPRTRVFAAVAANTRASCEKDFSYNLLTERLSSVEQTRSNVRPSIVLIVKSYFDLYCRTFVISHDSRSLINALFDFERQRIAFCACSGNVLGISPSRYNCCDVCCFVSATP